MQFHTIEQQILLHLNTYTAPAIKQFEILRENGLLAKDTYRDLGLFCTTMEYKHMRKALDENEIASVLLVVTFVIVLFICVYNFALAKVQEKVDQQAEATFDNHPYMNTPMSPDGSTGYISDYVSNRGDGTELAGNHCKVLFHNQDTQTPPRKRSAAKEDERIVDLDKLLYESANNPKVLIGCVVLVKGRGSGVVKSIQKRMFQSTLFEIRFEDGTTSALPLKRSSRKGTIPFNVLSRPVY